MEIFTGKEGEIVLKKYSPMADLTAFAQQYVEAISQSLRTAGCHHGPGFSHSGGGNAEEGADGQGASQ